MVHILAGAQSDFSRHLARESAGVEQLVGAIIVIERAGERPPKPPWLEDDPDFDMLAERLSTIHYTMSAELYSRLS